MSIPKLALVVFTLLAGTAVSVQAYLESHRPIALSTQVLVRTSQPAPQAPRPEAPDAAPAGFLEAPEPELGLDEPAVAPAPVLPSAALPATTPALVVEAAAPAPAGDVSRWITVRRDGVGHGSDCAGKARPRAASGCAPTGATPALPMSGGPSSVCSPPTVTRPD